MKNLKYTLILFGLLIPFITFSQDLVSLDEHNHSEFELIQNENETNVQTVYVCTGQYSYAYHSRNDCPGLNNCKGQIQYTDEYYATSTLQRKPCCRCWNNVVNNCKDDNPSYGSSGGSGGGNDEALGYVAIVAVAFSAVILSNDLYVYPTYSLDDNSKNGVGWSFGFRKTFDHSALEYGASIINSKHDYYSYNGTYIGKHNREKWGWNFNYIHHFFESKTADWMTPYAGLSVNYFNDFGYGGIVGTKMRLFDRLDFDVRYEYTTETSRIQAGLIFTYQKKYFWKK